MGLLLVGVIVGMIMVVFVMFYGGICLLFVMGCDGLLLKLFLKISKNDIFVRNMMIFVIVMGLIVFIVLMVDLV